MQDIPTGLSQPPTGHTNPSTIGGNEPDLSSPQALALRLLESLPQGVAALNQDGDLLCVNKTLLQLIGLQSLEVSFPLSIACEACPEALRALLGPCLDRPADPYEVESAVEGMTIPSRTLRVERRPMQDAPACSIVLVTDITPQKTAESGRAEFIAQIAHELRTPLQHIMGFAGIMSDMDELEPEEYQHFSSQINSETNVMARLVSDLAELGLITGGRFSVEKSRLDLAQLVSDVTARTEPGASQQNLVMDCVVPPHSVPVYGDAVRLSQVLVNLLANAIKYVPSGGQIHVRLDLEQDKATVSVTDNGKGIPADAVEHVFDQFFQVPGSGHRSHRGMGLGLYISREIIHAHDGQIWVESKQSKGSTFAFRLSLAPESEANK